MNTDKIKLITRYIQLREAKELLSELMEELEAQISLGEAYIMDYANSTEDYFKTKPETDINEGSKSRSETMKVVAKNYWASLTPYQQRKRIKAMAEGKKKNKRTRKMN